MSREETETETGQDAGAVADSVVINLLETTDALVWANEFQRIVIDGGIEIDAELMLGWFANAMSAQMKTDAPYFDYPAAKRISVGNM